MTIVPLQNTSRQLDVRFRAPALVTTNLVIGMVKVVVRTIAQKALEPPQVLERALENLTISAPDTLCVLVPLLKINVMNIFKAKRT